MLWSGSISRILNHQKLTKRVGIFYGQMMLSVHGRHLVQKLRCLFTIGLKIKALRIISVAAHLSVSRTNSIANLFPCTWLSLNALKKTNIACSYLHQAAIMSVEASRHQRQQSSRLVKIL